MTQRDAIRSEYEKTVKRLIGTGHWDEMPAPEDQLPDEQIPREFFDFWSCGRGAP